MKISGFTVIRNAELMGYPILQSIQSALPVVDEFVVGIGQSDDQTKDLILSLRDPKIRVFDAYWDTSKTNGGRILSEKTNEALNHCSNDWCLYLQADEVLHERDLVSLMQAVECADRDLRVSGLLFQYVHFYGSYDIVATSRKWYRHEVRMVRKSSGIQSVGDAQSFRVNGQKPLVAEAKASIFHYGWVKAPRAMGRKAKMLDQWWHGIKEDDKGEDFEYDNQYGLKKFTGSHPALMRPLVQAQNWHYEPRRTLGDWTLNDLNLWASDIFENIFGYRIGEYKPYQLLKPK